MEHTRLYRIRPLSEAWSWWNLRLFSSTAVNRRTGMLMRPKVMAPFQMDRMAGMTPMILLRLSSRTLNPTSGKRGANPRRILGQDSRIALWLSVPLSTIPTMTGRMWVEAWSPEYGTSYGIDAPDPDAAE